MNSEVADDASVSGDKSDATPAFSLVTGWFP
jgi:hypothetical protein